ncbi:MAG: thiol:disulfide interchange protein DsbA/DsbL [Gammaproteobacteria bacterium]|nr:thiol:disulfide interchange protein DsbA/DsbL [Gammaproteobacteria bacterium]
MMEKFLKITGTLVLLFVVSAAIAADDHAHATAGQGYLPLDPAVPRLVENDARHEVVELFWYGCSHCFDFEPYINKWKKEKSDDVNFVRVPAIFNARWEQHARAYYALEIMGKLEQGHELLFSGIHEQGRGLHDLDSMARYLATHDIDEAKFRESFASFAVETKINRAKQLIRQYQVTGVPAVIVDGKYKTSASDAGGYSQLVDVINSLTVHEGE